MSKDLAKKEATKVHWEFDKQLLRNIRVVALKSGVNTSEYVQQVLRHHLAALPPIDLRVAEEQAEDQSESQDKYKGVPLPY